MTYKGMFLCALLVPVTVTSYAKDSDSHIQKLKEKERCQLNSPSQLTPLEKEKMSLCEEKVDQKEDGFSYDEEDETSQERNSCQVNEDRRREQSRITSEAPATESSFLFQSVKLTRQEAESIWNNMPKNLRILVNKLADKDNRYEGTLPNVIVLYGPNGTGKSKTAALIAKKIRRNPVFINSGFVGTMYKNSEKFNLGEAVASVVKTKIPSVIILDEADILTSPRANDVQNDNSLDKAIGALIDTCEKNPNIFFIFTTNKAGSLGDKLFDLIGGSFYELGLPSAQARKDILDSYIESFSDMVRDETLNLNLIAGLTSDKDSLVRKSKNWLGYGMTEGFSIRRLRALVRDARSLALARNEEVAILKQIDFEIALKIMHEQLDVYYKSTWMARLSKNIADHPVMYSAGAAAVTGIVLALWHYNFVDKCNLEQAAKIAKEQAELAEKARRNQKTFNFYNTVAANPVGAILGYLLTEE